jgi:hypothetical protein
LSAFSMRRGSSSCATPAVRVSSGHLISDILQQAHGLSLRWRNMGAPRQEVTHGHEPRAISSRAFDG